MKAINLVCLLGLAACNGGQTSYDKIGDAQYCLDNLGTAPAVSDVDACTAKVDSVSSAGAEGIRCAGDFIREGFSGGGQRFIDAFTAINGGTTATNTQNLMGILTFTVNNAYAADFADTQTAFNSCLASGGRGSTLLAGFSLMTMDLVNYYAVKDGCGTTASTSTSGYLYYNLATCISNVGYALDTAALVSAASADATVISTQTTLGSTIISVVSTSCTGSSANASLCGTLTSAVAAGGTSPRAVAISFLTTTLGL